MVVTLKGPQGRDGGQNSAYRLAATLFPAARLVRLRPDRGGGECD